MSLLTKQGFLKLATEKRPFKDVELEDGNGGTFTVRIVRMSGKSRSNLEQFMVQNQNKPGFMLQMRKRLMLMACVDEEMKPLFEKDTDIDPIMEMDGVIIDALCTEIAKFNAVGESEVEQAEKNSETDQNSSSGLF